MTSPLRLLGIALGLALLGAAGLKVAGHFRAVGTAKALCQWLNARDGAAPPLAMGPELASLVRDLRQHGQPVACTTGASPHAEGFLTETGIVLREARGRAVGLRLTTLERTPRVLGYWTP